MALRSVGHSLHALNVGVCLGGRSTTKLRYPQDIGRGAPDVRLAPARPAALTVLANWFMEGQKMTLPIICTQWFG